MRFRSPHIIGFLLLLLASLSLPAEDPADLKSLVKKVQPGTVVVLTYDDAEKSLGLGSGFFSLLLALDHARALNE